MLTTPPIESLTAVSGNLAFMHVCRLPTWQGKGIDVNLPVQIKCRESGARCGDEQVSG